MNADDADLVCVIRVHLRFQIAKYMSKTAIVIRRFRDDLYKSGRIRLDENAAQWFDSRGVSFPIMAYVEGNTLTSLWGSPDKEEGKSTYQLVDDSTLRVVDSVKQKDGTFREFSSATLKRK